MMATTIAVKTDNAALAAALDGFDFTVGADGRQEEEFELARLAGADIAREIHAICGVETEPIDPIKAFAELHRLGQRLCALADAICAESAEGVAA